MDKVDLTLVEWAKWFGQVYAQHVAEQIVIVQPVNIDFVALMNDPMCNMLMANFISHTQGKPRPYPYG